MTPRWAGSDPVWPELATGITDLRMATGELATDGPHKEWYEHHDPILRLARDMAKGGAESVRRMSGLDEAIRNRIVDAAEFALNSPWPALETALHHVFAPEMAS